MHYEINGRIGFSPGENLVWRLEDNDNFQLLPRFAGYLLETFIRHNGQPLTREFLLDALWHQNGLTASGNSLNNYISMVRKALSNFDLPDVINTIPKYGFCFTVAEIVCVPGVTGDAVPEPEPAQDAEAELAAAGEPAELPEQPADPLIAPATAVKAVARVRQMWMGLGVALGGALLIALPVFFAKRHSSDVTRIAPLVTYPLGQCQVALYGKENAANISAFKQQVELIIAQYRINCSRPTQLYYEPLPAMDISGYHTQRILLAACVAGAQGSCVNYLIKKDYHD